MPENAAIASDGLHGRSSESLFRAIFEAAPVGMAEVAIDGRWLRGNRKLCAILGQDAANLANLTLQQLTHPDDLAGEQALLQQLLAGEREGYSLEKRFLTPQGQAVWGNVTVALVRDGQGQPAYLIATLEDLQGRRAAEQASLQSAALAREIVESTPNALIMVDEQGQIVLVNALAEELFGYDRDELQGMNVDQLVPAPQRHHHQRLRQGFSHSPSKREMGKGRDLYARRKDGTEFPVEIGLNPIASGQGRWVLAAVVDISARKAAQLHLETALHEKTVLLNEVHHRVKNNLQVISSLLNLQAGNAAPEVRQALMESQSRVRAMTLIHQLIYEHSNVSRLDLVQYCRRLGSLLRELFGASVRNVSFVCEGRDDEVLVSLQQAVPCGLVVAEAITNAFKHAFPGQRQGTVTVRLHSQQQQVEIGIRDDGVGMAQPEKMFEGSSLGAQLMNLLAEQLGGRLAVRAQPEQGCEVTINFTLTAGQEEE